MRPAARTIFGTLAALCTVAALWLGALGCGPSALSKAYDAYSAAVSPRLDAETSFWDQLAERARDQEDEAGTARYRQFLAEKAKPFYAQLETALAAVVPGHERLAAAHEQILGFVRSRREFVDLELRRLELGTKAPALRDVQRAQEEVEAAHEDYMESVNADPSQVPDHRLATMNAAKTEFMEGKYRRAIEGAGDVEEAVDHLRKVCLPQLRELRDGRFEDTPQGRKFRRCVVATEEFFRLLADELPTLVATVRSAARSETVLRQADAQRTNFQQQLGAVRRDR